VRPAVPPKAEMQRLNELSASEIARRIAAGETTSEAVIRACLARIRTREPIVHAWSGFDPDAALRQARERDRSPPRGPLHGVPIGVKDIIDTADMPTEMGSPIYRGHRPKSDASCVALVRAAGAVILGKTVTTEFANIEPGATTNPHNSAHTPGGSSSGSAAGIADFMVPLAFGTQTGGSVLRPASFCGIIGYKPSFGLVNRAGVKPSAESLDTIGLMARTIDDVELLAKVLLNRAPSRLDDLAAAPRIGLCRTFLWPTANPETVAAIDDAATRLAASGAAPHEVVLPDEFAGLNEAREAIGNYELARAMAWEWSHHREQISEALRRSIKLGFDVPYETFAAALRLADRCRAELNAAFGDNDVLLAPAVTGEAPRGLTSTGDPRLQGLWTLLYVPTITLPTHKGPNGLPVGIQLVGRLYDDEGLLRAARWVMARLGG
jgi:Asp-tRNA(Asn)/Glu-tRNA(Gln) amidotransferase A subunit family amidase